MNGSATDLEYLLSPRAVRERSKKLFDLALKGETHFKINLSKLPEAARYVLEVTRGNYPDFKIPFHSRYGHFQAGNVDRLGMLNQKIAALDPAEKARVKMDLIIVSVLLDAGAGMSWKFQDPLSGRSFSKSEGLAIASLDLFLKGKFHSEGKIGADGAGLEAFSTQTLEEGFQVSSMNPLLGIEGRAGILNALGKVFTGSRPGALFDVWSAKAGAGTLDAEEILKTILNRLGPIWPGRVSLNGVNLGDAWVHPLLGAPESTESLIPFHKLSQWMSYSLMEPLMETGMQIRNLDGLTGLPEYRNGGLFLDLEVIELKDQDQALKVHAPDSELILEWRALTVTLLDQIAEELRKILGKSKAELPLVKILEGGTWHAGRKIAASLRSDGGPPLQLKSDGTVF